MEQMVPSSVICSLKEILAGMTVSGLEFSCFLRLWLFGKVDVVTS
jgi:hypothetical protein